MSKQSSDFEADIGKKYVVGKVTVSIESVIAEGGFGVVFLTRSSSNHRYALKRLYVNEEAKLNACKREIQIMSSLSNHKNMVTFVESSITKDYKGVWEVLILMQYYPGTCMKMVNDGGSAGLNEPQVLTIFCDICEAVSRLHHCQTPILHRDLKIENILCDSNNTFVLCDFGSATARCYIPGRDERNVTEIEEDINKHTTLSHRSPEMVNLYGHKSITTKADIWEKSCGGFIPDCSPQPCDKEQFSLPKPTNLSAQTHKSLCQSLQLNAALGVTLYRLCFRVLPFGESTLAIQTGNLNIPESSPYSHGLHALICYCLEADPDLRPDIFQVSHFGFLLAKRKCPVKNIHNSSIANQNKLIESMLNRTSKNSLLSTPRSSDRGTRLEQTTTITPRERPKAVRNASAAALNVPAAAQRRLISDGASRQQSLPALPSVSQLQQAGYTIEQQQYIIQQYKQKLEQQRLLNLQQQELLRNQQLAQQQQNPAAASQPQLTPQQQQQYAEQQLVYQQQQLAHQQHLAQQQAAQHAAQHAAQQQQLLAQQYAQAEQNLLEEQYFRQQQQQLYEQQQQQHLTHQQFTQQRPQFTDAQQQFVDSQQFVDPQQLQYQLQQYQLQQHIYAQQQYQQVLAAQDDAPLNEQQQLLLQHQLQQQQQLHQQQLQQQQQQQLQQQENPQESPTSNGQEATSAEHAFEDDFSQTVMFEADFSKANFTSSSTLVDSTEAEAGEAANSGPDDQALPTSELSKRPDGDFKVTSISEPSQLQSKSAESSQAGGKLTPPLTIPKRAHRRNVSDTSAISIGKGNSAFRAYTPSKNSTKLTASLGSLSSFTGGSNIPEASVVRSKSEDNSLSDGTHSSQATKSSSVEGLHQNWNPFADDGDSMSDDVMFGQEFDRLRCGSQSSIQNVKSREDLVMLENGVAHDPFEAAPFNPKTKGRLGRKEQKLAENYSRLSAATSDENLLDVEIPATTKIQNQTIFGVPIPFTRRSDRTDKYHKVPTDSDSDSLCMKDEEDESLDKTLKSVQYMRMENEHSSNSSNSGTLTRSSQFPLDSTANGDGEGRRPHSCDSSYSSTVTPPISSSENLSDPFGAAAFAGKKDSNNTPRVEQFPVPLLPNNPFLHDIIGQGQQPSADDSQVSESTPRCTAESPGYAANTLKSLEKTDKASERTRQPSFSDFASQRNATERSSGSSSLQDFTSTQIEVDDKPSSQVSKLESGETRSNSLAHKIQKSRTLDSINMVSNSGAGDKPQGSASASESYMRRSRTDYEVGLNDISFEVKGDEDDLSDSETLLTDTYGSLRKKEKGWKSPKSAKNSKSPRGGDAKKSLTYTANSLECEGALTNEAFSEQEVSTEREAGPATSNNHVTPPPASKPITKPHPPTAPKPSSDRRPPIAVKPRTKAKPSPENTSKQATSMMQTPTKELSADIKVHSKSETKAPQGATPAKDAYKTHKRYSSYDLATGRAELSICAESESSKSSLVGKEGKTKKKNKIGLGIF